MFENGFPIALFEEPNRFDGYSVKQLCMEIINGIENSIKISKVKFDLSELKRAAKKEETKEMERVMLEGASYSPQVGIQKNVSMSYKMVLKGIRDFVYERESTDSPVGNIKNFQECDIKDLLLN